MTILRSLARYFDFQGRARRSEYWWFWLFYGLLTLGVGLLTLWLDGALGMRYLWVYSLPGALSLLLVIPMLSVTVRRLHDIDRSGWWLLMNLVPVGGIVLLIYYCREGTPEANRFGPPEAVL